MGRLIASYSDARTTVSSKRWSPRVSRPAQPRARAAATSSKTPHAPTEEPLGPKPHRSEADLDLARRMLAALQAGADIRQRKVRRLKAAIKIRAYENDLKLEVALDRLRATVGEAMAQE